MTLHLTIQTPVEPITSIRIHQHLPRAVFKCLYVHLFWKTPCIQQQSDTDSGRRVSAKGHCRVEVQLSGSLWLIKESSDSCWQSGAYPPVNNYSCPPTTCVKQPVLLLSPHFSLSYFCSTFFSLAFVLLPVRFLFSCLPPFLFNSIALPFLPCLCSRAEVTLMDRNRNRKKKKKRPSWQARRRSPAMCPELFLPLDTCYWEHQRLTAVPPTPHPHPFHLAQEMCSNFIQTTFHFIFHKDIFGEDFSIHLADSNGCDCPPHLQLWYHSCFQLPSLGQTNFLLTSALLIAQVFL